MAAPERIRPVVLVAEDEAILGIEIAEALENEGFEVAGPFATCAAAESWLHAHAPIHAAILDSSLRDGPCEKLAHDLTVWGVPFIVHSGHGAPADITAPFSGVPWFVKLVPVEALMRALHDLPSRNPAPPSAGRDPVERSDGR
jgi:DNA-binding NarL/FixJ family response regulator